MEDLDWLHDTLKATLLSEGVTHLFPVQEQVIPFVIKENEQPHPFWPHDICVSAPTGSGKTLAFVLPIIQVIITYLHNLTMYRILCIYLLFFKTKPIAKYSLVGKWM